jgi:cell fate (sporulation/competence/biofilm development) regulator YlbF (YheA/YmcA/DUF963 family)
VKKLNKSLIIAKELHEELLNHPLVIEYKKYKEIINSNPKYKSIDLELRSMQKDIVKNYSEELVNEYKEKKDKFLNDEVVAKYLSLKEELNNLLNTLQDIINYNL